MAQVNVNLQNYDTQMGFDTLPPGWYEAEVEDSEIKEGPKGAYIQWTWSIIGKPNKVWDNMSLGNEVSLRRLKTMAACCGHKNPNFIADTQELHGKKCRIKLKIEVDESGKYEPKNNVSMFKPLGDTPLPTETMPQAHEIPSSQPAETAKQAMPWER